MSRHSIYRYSASGIVRLVLVALMVSCWSGGASLKANDFNYVQLEKLTPADIVISRVSRVRGNDYIVDLGYAHGMTKGAQILVSRIQNGGYRPIGLLRVTYVHDEFCIAERTSGVSVEVNDLAMIPAEELAIWNSRSRMRNAVDIKWHRQARSTGYDTGDLNSKLIVEILTDDRLTMYDRMKAGMLQQVSVGRSARSNDVDVIERFAYVTGRNRPPHLAHLDAPMEKSDQRQERLFRDGAARAAGAIGLSDLRSRYGDPSSKSVSIVSDEVSDRLLSTTISSLDSNLSHEEVEALKVILGELVEERLRGDIIFGRVEEEAVTRIRKQLPRVEGFLRWAQFMAIVAETLENNRLRLIGEQ